MKIIRATKKNVADIVYLNSFVQQIHVLHHPDFFKPPINDINNQNYFKAVLEKENNYILIAYKNNKAVGYLWAELQYQPELPLLYEQKQFYIHHVSVDDEFKGQGIGKALFNEIESIAEEHGINKLALDVWAFNEDAQNIFKKLGFSVYNVNMWKKLN